jgi:hypothetical protein
VKAPTEYKTGSKWKLFKKSAIASLNSVKGTQNIPIAYVIREAENPDPNVVYQSKYHRLISITPLLDWIILVTMASQCVVTSEKKKVPPRTQVKSIPDVIHGTWDSDSYANTCIAGPNCIVMEYTDQVMNASAYSDQLDVQQNVPIVTAAIAYDDPHTGTTYILVLGQAIYIRDPK